MTTRTTLTFFGCLAIVVVGIEAMAYLASCAPSRPALYGAELAACSETSTTFEESVTCENGVRSRYGRPPRDAGGDR